MARLCAENVIAVARRARAPGAGGRDDGTVERRAVRSRSSQSSATGGAGATDDQRGALTTCTPERVVDGRRARARRGQRHAEPAARTPSARPRQSRARRPPHDDAQRHRHRLGLAALRQGLRRASTTTTTGTATSTRSATSPTTARSTTAGRRRRSRRRARRSTRSRSSTNGLVGRGVLLDVPRLRGVPLARARRAHLPRGPRGGRARAGRRPCGEGDILLVRTGHARRLAELGPWETATAKAGLHPTAMPFVAERGVAALGSRRQQRHGAEQHRGRRLPDPRPRAQRDGRAPARLPAVRGPPRGLRARRGAGSSCSSPRRCASPAAPARRSTRSRSSDEPQ